MRPLAIVLLAIVAQTILANASRSQSVYRTRADIVVMDVAVTDGRKGVTDLLKGDFEVRDNGVVQEVLDFSRETLPLDVRVTVDISGSMTSADRVLVESALAQVSAALGPADRVEVLTFASHVTLIAPLRPPPLSVSLPAATVGLGTSVFDALLLSLVTPRVFDRRQFILFMTDGDDTASYFDGHTAIETAKHANAPATIVLVANRATPVHRGVLHSVAATTGGDVLELKKNDSLSQAFLRALENFRSSYVLRFTPTGVAPTGWHDLSVTMRSKKKYHVRARRGYWAD